jgi:hypothetical protein
MGVFHTGAPKSGLVNLGKQFFQIIVDRCLYCALHCGFENDVALRFCRYEVVKDWRPWLATLDGSDDPESAQRAGYAIDYGNGTQFKYVTVQGAGHSE